MSLPLYGVDFISFRRDGPFSRMLLVSALLLGHTTQLNHVGDAKVELVWQL